jgi:hypothetical protein
MGASATPRLNPFKPVDTCGDDGDAGDGSHALQIAKKAVASP